MCSNLSASATCDSRKTVALHGVSHTLKHQRVAAHMPAEVAINVHADQSMLSHTVERIEDTSDPGLPANRSTKGYCQNCTAYLGDFYNSWYRVTSSYYIPALRASFKSLLKESGKQKAASRGTDLEGCTIQPLSCPAVCIDSPIGFVVVDAPSGKRHYRNRDFFKLSRIELRCEPSPTQSFVVTPLENTSKDLSRAEDFFSPSPTPEPIKSEPTMGPVEMDSLPPQQGHHHIRQEHRRDLAYQQAAIPQNDSNGQPSASVAVHSPQVPISRPNSTSKVHDQQVQTPSPIIQTNPEMRTRKTASSSAPTSVLVSTMPGPPPDGSQSHSSHESRKAERQQYPQSPPEVSLDAIQRLQTQISQNSGALAAHTRDMRRGEESIKYLEETLRREFNSQIAFQSVELQRVDGAVAKLHHEMQAIRQVLEDLSHEVYANKGEVRSQQRPGALSAQQVSAQDSALELMAQQLALTSHKANEVDALKLTIEIMKNKIQRLEDGGRPHPGPGAMVPSTVNRGLPSTHHSPQLQSHHSFTTPAKTTTPERTQHYEPVPSQSGGWTTINASVKRSQATDADNLYNGHSQVPNSTKRQRLTTESAPSFVNSTPQSHTIAQDSQSQFIPHAQPLPSQPPLSGSNLSTQSQQSPHPSFATQDGPSDDSWRPASQRDIEHRPRGRGRGGGGPGSRGGRVRKSIPSHFHTPEWEREDWYGVPESQTSSEGFYHHAMRSTPGTARRGTGGGGSGSGGPTRRGFTPTDRATSMGVAPTIDFESPGDTYEHGKKTRTKPVRNADGVLIRKDGRPDMRSQSSAANLRKVHSRREGETEFSPSGTPTTIRGQNHGTEVNATDTPSPTTSARSAQQGANAANGTKSKHDMIMGKMFPRGVDESRKEHDYTRELFDKEHDHAVQPRSQAAQRVANKPVEQHMKKEPTEPGSMVEMDVQSSRGEDGGVDMSSGEKRADVESGDGREMETTQGTGDSPGSAHSDGHEYRTIPETQVMDTA
ncbi:hypothetical protein T440DRAFT_498890 [Plenodomus tracheiphilus IPT5]|uniref:Uncharacterized protein n=1 Tax=Plenodomus tracheiphilus IPT5 TaxID=1408161 RepID=A0A6A7B5K6_9PLEO|nr:hypothetical protein T440DRAFT_498890 [Plenodomus tracheiphilus IPT5]